MLLTKRRFLTGAAAVAATSATKPVLAQQPIIEQMPEGALGCRISDSQFAALETGGWLQGVCEEAGRNTVCYYDRSGDDIFDRMLGQALVTMARTFSVFPAFLYYDDSAGRNAFATHHCLSGYRDKTCHGTIGFGAHLALSLRAQEAGDAAILAICAHEFGHILAFRRNLKRQLIDASLNLSRTSNCMLISWLGIFCADTYGM